MFFQKIYLRNSKKFFFLNKKGVVILTCTISNHDHCLIFWTLNCKEKYNKIYFYKMLLWIHYVHVKIFGINIMSEKNIF